MDEKDQSVYAEVGQVVTNPEFVAQWRRDPNAFHEQRKQNVGKEYDAQMLDQMLQSWDQMPEYEMQKIFTNLVKRAEGGFQTMLLMSQVTFAVGVCIIVVAFIVEVLGLLGLIEIDWQTALAGGGVLGGIGLGTIVAIFVRGPQNDIQEAVGNLAQVQVAFLSFLSQYKKLSALPTNTLEEAEKLTELTSALRRETMQDIETFLEDDADSEA